MTDINTNPPTPEPEPEPGPKRSRADLNKRWIEKLAESQQIVTSAQKPEYLGAFTEGDIDAACLAALDADIKAAQKLTSTTLQKSTSKKSLTEDETASMNALIERIHEVQKRARQKYAATDPTVLGDYAVARKFTASRAMLEQTATNILDKLAQDKLPGINGAKTQALQAALDAYRQVQTDQVGEQSGAVTGRKQLEAAVQNIIGRKRSIQYAADAQWPHTNKANAGIRAEFKLPPNRAMK
jgi:hypothetical protein